MPAGSVDALPALDRVLSAGRATHTGPEVAAAAGVDPEWAARVWRAAGYEGEFHARELSVDDVRVLAAAADLVREGRFDEAELLQFARMFNLAAAPLAEAAAGAVHRMQAQADGLEVLEGLDGSLAQFEDVLLHTWRRRLLRVLASGRAAERRTEGVGFADIAGFTSLVRRSEESALESLDRLEALVFDVVAAHGGRVIKTIGDEVMWVHPDREGMVATCLDVASAARREGSGVPPLRIGAAWGELVAARGDRFGTPVNLASRLVRRCRPGSVLLSPELTEAAGVPPGRPRRIRGIGWMRLGRVSPRDAG